MSTEETNKQKSDHLIDYIGGVWGQRGQQKHGLSIIVLTNSYIFLPSSLPLPTCPWVLEEWARVGDTAKATSMTTWHQDCPPHQWCRAKWAMVIFILFILHTNPDCVHTYSSILFFCPLSWVFVCFRPCCMFICRYNVLSLSLYCLKVSAVLCSANSQIAAVTTFALFPGSNLFLHTLLTLINQPFYNHASFL